MVEYLPRTRPRFNNSIHTSTQCHKRGPTEGINNIKLVRTQKGELCQPLVLRDNAESVSFQSWQVFSCADRFLLTPSTA